MAAFVLCVGVSGPAAAALAVAQGGAAIVTPVSAAAVWVSIAQEPARAEVLRGVTAALTPTPDTAPMRGVIIDFN